MNCSLGDEVGIHREHYSKAGHKAPANQVLCPFIWKSIRKHEQEVSQQGHHSFVKQVHFVFMDTF